jgi:hypothetical protein
VSGIDSPLSAGGAPALVGTVAWGDPLKAASMRGDTKAVLLLLSQVGQAGACGLLGISLILSMTNIIMVVAP